MSLNCSSRSIVAYGERPVRDMVYEESDEEEERQLGLEIGLKKRKLMEPGDKDKEAEDEYRVKEDVKRVEEEMIGGLENVEQEGEEVMEKLLAGAQEASGATETAVPSIPGGQGNLDVRVEDGENALNSSDDSI